MIIETCLVVIAVCQVVIAWVALTPDKPAAASSTPPVATHIVVSHPHGRVK